MILDRRPDVHLAKRSGAEGWLVKPLDPLRLRRAIREILDGGEYFDDSYQPVRSGGRDRSLEAPAPPGHADHGASASPSPRPPPGHERRRWPWSAAKARRRGQTYKRRDTEPGASEQERQIIERLADLRDMEVREVMTPRVDVVVLTIPVRAEDVSTQSASRGTVASRWWWTTTSTTWSASCS